MTKKTKAILASLEKPDNEFFTHELVEELLDTAETKTKVDFNTMLGDTIREKYENIYQKIHELSNELVKKGAKGYFWIVTSPEIGSVFETATYRFDPCSAEEYGYNGYHQRPLGITTVEYKGMLHGTWRLYTDSSINANLALIGANFSKKSASQYAVLELANSII
jgi:hypothetical protein